MFVVGLVVVVAVVVVVVVAGVGGVASSSSSSSSSTYFVVVVAGVGGGAGEPGGLDRHGATHQRFTCLEIQGQPEILMFCCIGEEISVSAVK